MKQTKRISRHRAPIFGCAWILAFLCSCSAPMELLKTTGEVAEIRLTDRSEWTVEIVAVQDSGLFCLEVGGGETKAGMSSVVLFLPAVSIDRVSVQGIRNNGWPVGVLLFQVLPAIGLGIAAGSVDEDNAGPTTMAFLVPAGFSALFFAVSGVHNPEVAGPLTAAGISELRKYARFAGPLTPAQVDLLLKAYGQRLPVVPVVTSDRTGISGNR